MRNHLRPEVAGASLPTDADCHWQCRQCCDREGQPYTYPPNPWCYCRTCKQPLTVREQELTILRLRIEGRLATYEPAGIGQLATTPVGSTGDEAVEDRDSDVLTVPEVAKLLRKSPKAIYSQFERGSLPGAFKVGARLFVRRRDLLGFKAGGRVPSRRSRR